MVYGPLVDLKEFPEDVDITLIEGAVCNEDNVEIIHTIRQRSKIVISFGDCAVTGNVTGLRDNLEDDPKQSVLHRGFVELATLNAEPPSDPGVLPPLLDHVKPVHQVIPVDYFIPGCPPSADRIRHVLEALLEGKEPEREPQEIKFG